MNEEKVMSAQEVAELLNVSKGTVYNWVKAGLKGKYEKRIGAKRRMVFTEKDIVLFLQVDSIQQWLSERME